MVPGVVCHVELELLPGGWIGGRIGDYELSWSCCVGGDGVGSHDGISEELTELVGVGVSMCSFLSRNCKCGAPTYSTNSIKGVSGFRNDLSGNCDDVASDNLGFSWGFGFSFI